MGFLVKTKMNAYTKLTVVMCCQIVARKSVAQLKKSNPFFNIILSSIDFIAFQTAVFFQKNTYNMFRPNFLMFLDLEVS